MPIPEKREAVDAQVEPRQETDVWVQDTGAAGAWKGKEGPPRALGETVALSVP